MSARLVELGQQVSHLGDPPLRVFGELATQRIQLLLDRSHTPSWIPAATSTPEPDLQITQ
jgi:hypothetical protein